MTDEPQLTRAALADMTARQIDEARRAGQLNDLLAGKAQPEEDDQVDDAEDTWSETPEIPLRRVPKPNRAQGINGGTEPERPIDRQTLASLPPEEVNRLRREGKLAHLTGQQPLLSRQPITHVRSN